MRKHQDVQSLESADSPERKIEIAMNGRKAVSGAADILLMQAKMELTKHLRDHGFIIAPDCYRRPTKAEEKTIKREIGRLKDRYDEHLKNLTMWIGEQVVKSLSEGNSETFTHLADACVTSRSRRKKPACPADLIFKSSNSDGVSSEDLKEYERISTSPVEFAILSLSVAHSKTWPRVPMSRKQLLEHIEKLTGISIEQTPLTRAIKRTGIKLTAREKVGRPAK